MPISPGQAREHRAAKYRSEFATVCEVIDNFLIRCHHWPADWGVKNVPHWSAEIQEKILETYRKIGWDVVFIEDDFDSDKDCLRFSENEAHKHGHLSLGLS